MASDLDTKKREAIFLAPCARAKKKTKKKRGEEEMNSFVFWSQLPQPAYALHLPKNGLWKK